MKDLEMYFRSELADGKIDFHCRAACFEGGSVMIYIHPEGKPGLTTSMLIVEGNTVREAYPVPEDL